MSNTQDLDEIRKIVKRYDSLKTKDNPEGNPFHPRNLSLDETVEVLLDWHNKQVEKMLDRLLNGTTTIYLDTEPNNPVKSNIEPLLFKAEIKAAIRAERNKLKERQS